MTRTIPCVYFARKPEMIPVFFCSAESVGRALSIAAALRFTFRVSAWVADWRLVAHEPSAVERAMIEAGAW